MPAARACPAYHQTTLYPPIPYHASFVTNFTITIPVERDVQIECQAFLLRFADQRHPHVFIPHLRLKHRCVKRGMGTDEFIEIVRVRDNIRDGEARLERASAIRLVLYLEEGKLRLTYFRART
jgi:hypothetical protein